MGVKISCVFCRISLLTHSVACQHLRLNSSISGRRLSMAHLPFLHQGLSPGFERRPQEQSNSTPSMVSPGLWWDFPLSAHSVTSGSQCLSAVSLLMSNHEFLDVNLLASLLNDTEFVMIIVLLTSHLLWHHLFS